MADDDIARMARALLMPVADKSGAGSDLNGPYMPNQGWNTLTPAQREQLEKNSRPTFSDEVTDLDHLRSIIDEHGSVQVDPRVPIFDQFIRSPQPDIERFNYKDDPNRTIFLRKRPPLTS